MAYPNAARVHSLIRAQLAETPETSDFTSTQARIQGAEDQQEPIHVAHFQGSERKDKRDGIAFSLKGYIGLVDATGQAIREVKRGHINQSQLPLVQRLNIDAETWLFTATTIEESLGRGHLGVDWHRSQPKARVRAHRKALDLLIRGLR